MRQLVQFPSISHTSNVAVTDWIDQQLQQLGFVTERVDYRDQHGVSKSNVIGRRSPANASQRNDAAAADEWDSDRSRANRSRAGGLAYFAHSDVVPVDGWNGPGEADPFQATWQNERLFARGACDMKGSLATMLAAASRVDQTVQVAPLTIVCTADEEVGFEGAKQVVAHSKFFRELVAEQPLGIVGEPTRLEVVYAHKGIDGFRITSHGRAAHSSTRDGLNANLAMVPMLDEIKRLYDRSESEPQFRNEHFDPPTLTWNFGVSDHAQAVNVTPAESRAWVCFRPMPGVDGQELVEQAKRKAESLGLSFEPLFGGPPLWGDAERSSIEELLRITGGRETKTVCYGTDGGHFSELHDLVVCGPGDIAQAHTSDEWIALEQIQRGTDVYEQAIRHWCTSSDFA